jgi:hypothetical protein
MDQTSNLMNSHNAAMNSLMSKYSSKLMVEESKKRAKEMLDDNIGMELINAGLSSGKLGELGKHLTNKFLGRGALSKIGDVNDAVNAFVEKGHQGVLDHFANKPAGTGLSLRSIWPDGTGERLKAHIRSVYPTRDAATVDLGSRLTSSLRTKFDRERARGEGLLDRAGNAIERAKPAAIMDSINHTGGAVNDRLVDTMRVVKEKSAGAAAAVQERARGAAAVGQQRAREIAARNPVVQRRPEDGPAEAQGLSIRDKAKAILAEKKAALKAKFPDAFGQKEAREAAAKLIPKPVKAEAAAAAEKAQAPQRSTISRRAGRGMRRSYSATVEQIRRAPEALKQAVRKRFMGTDEQINLEDEINRRSARAGVLAAAARKQAVVEAQAKRVAVAAKPENILRPSIERPAKLSLPRRTGGVQFAEEANEFRFFRPGEEE